MNLADLLDSVGGTESLGKIAGSLGLDSAQTTQMVSALAPALMGALQKQTTSEDGLSSLKNALQTGRHQDYLDRPDLISSQESVADGNNILGHLLGSKDASRNVAAQAAESTGISASLIKQALPLIAGLAMGAVSKNSDGGKKLDDSAGDLFGDFGPDDALDLAKKFF